VEPAPANLKYVASQRDAAWTAKLVDIANFALAGCGGLPSKHPDIAQHLTITFDDRTRKERLGSAVPLARAHIEPPLMISAYQIVADYLALSEESSLVRTSSRVGT
jgi:hypothetical protein